MKKVLKKLRTFEVKVQDRFKVQFLDTELRSLGLASLELAVIGCGGCTETWTTLPQPSGEDAMEADSGALMTDFEFLDDVGGLAVADLRTLRDREFVLAVSDLDLEDNPVGLTYYHGSRIHEVSFPGRSMIAKNEPRVPFVSVVFERLENR